MAAADQLEQRSAQKNKPLLREKKLLEIIKDPKTLTGQQLQPTKIIWHLPGREIVTQNENGI